VASAPRAPEAADAHLALAEEAFVEERLDDAVRECDAALRFGDDTSRVSALYLKAWSLRGLGEHRAPGSTRKAIAALEEIVRVAPRSIGPSDAAIAESAGQEIDDLMAHEAGRTSAATSSTR
jgi:hypothetical protein